MQTAFLWNGRINDWFIAQSSAFCVILYIDLMKCSTRPINISAPSYWGSPRFFGKIAFFVIHFPLCDSCVSSTVALYWPKTQSSDISRYAGYDMATFIVESVLHSAHIRDARSIVNHAGFFGYVHQWVENIFLKYSTGCRQATKEISMCLTSLLVPIIFNYVKPKATNFSIFLR